MTSGDPTDERPAVWVGHVVLPTGDVAAAARFYIDLGMREIVTNEQISVLELRGGTHLVLDGRTHANESGAAVPFDIMVDDVDAMHAALTARGLAPTDIRRGDIHDSFSVSDADDYVLTINSSHAVGPV